MSSSTGDGDGERTTALQSRLDDLADSLRIYVEVPMDELHVAAVLESRGVTDRIAQERYGHDDVFALASTLERSLIVDIPVHRAPARPATASRLLVHGPLYVVPGLAVPALASWTEPRRLAVGLVAATLVGWVWGMATSTLGYQLRGQRREASAARSMIRMVLTGTALALLILVGFGAAGLVDRVVLAAATVQVVYQLAVGVLVFYSHEVTIAIAAAPAAVIAIIAIATGSPSFSAVPVVVATAVGTALIAAQAGRVLWRQRNAPESAAYGTRIDLAHSMAPSIAYAGMCAALLLATNVRFFTAAVDLALAGMPLILGMGVVELRAQRYVEAAASALDSHDELRVVRRRLWRRLALDIAVVLTVLGLLAVLLAMVITFLVGPVSRSGVALTAAHVLLGAVFLIGFVAARHAHFSWYVGAGSLVVGGYCALVLGAGLALDGIVAAFAVAVTVLAGVMLGAFALSSRQLPLFTW